MKLFLLTLALVALCVLGLCFNIIFRKDGKFPDTEIEHNKPLRKKGIQCAKVEERKLWSKKNRNSSWALNTFDKDTNKSYNELGGMGIISNVEELQKTVDEINYLIANPEIYKQRREKAFDFVKRNYCATQNIPFFFENVDNLSK